MPRFGSNAGNWDLLGPLNFEKCSRKRRRATLKPLVEAVLLLLDWGEYTPVFTDCKKKIKACLRKTSLRPTRDSRFVRVRFKPPVGKKENL